MGLKQFSAALAVLVSTSTAVGAQPWQNSEFGHGEYERRSHDMLDYAHEPAMRQLGPDAVRFSSQTPAGTGYIIVLSGNRRGEVSWFRRHAGAGWRQTRHEEFQISLTDYRGIADEVDRLLSEGASAVQDDYEEGEEIPMCEGGPGYLTERVRGNDVSWLTPACGGANGEIMNLLTSWIFAHLG
jgi:hypothetical protein